jgi:hypothetical protein
MNTESPVLSLKELLEYQTKAMWAAGTLYVVFMLFMLAFTIVNFIYTTSTLVRAIRSNSPDKTMWVLVIILVPLIGWILYRVLTREQALAAYQSSFPVPPPPVVSRTAPPVFVHPVCRPAQTQAVADSVQAAMDEMVRKRRAARSSRN